MSDLIERAPLLCEAITEAFGERCEDFEPDCWCCRAWAELDGLTRKLAEARDKALEEAAKVADDNSLDFERQAATNEDPEMHDALLIAADGCELTASAIRYLKEKP